MEEISRTTVKLTKIVVKYIPILIAIDYLAASVLSCFGITFGFILPIYRLSLLSFICLFACSKLLKFCIWHRLPLYYSIVIDLLNIIDFYITIPIANKQMLLIYLLIAGLFIIIGMISKENYNRSKRRLNMNNKRQ